MIALAVMKFWKITSKVLPSERLLMQIHQPTLLFFHVKILSSLLFLTLISHFSEETILITSVTSQYVEIRRTNGYYGILPQGRLGTILLSLVDLKS